MPRAISQSARLFVIAVCAAVLAACAAPGGGDDTAAVNVPLMPLLAELSPLHLAAKSGDSTEVKARIKAGDDINARAGKWRYTPLHWAAETEHGYMIHILIEAGANVNIQGKDDLTPLHLAARKGYWVGVSILVHLGGARINAKDNKNRTPLDLAKANGHNDVVDLLLKAGAVEGKK